ncbi:barstar family protein [Dactylosporangium sp. NPDC000244]|uniref:barstar family protein n=1 Tax=Dactylosporangium sp. NPDC000244 TaxID=3154365 RepID=UPI00331EA5CB
MSTPSLTERQEPWVVFARAGDPWVDAEAAAVLRQGGQVVRLDAHELREPCALFATFARELAFPAYFGHNWDALVDCLRDWPGHGSATPDLAVLVDHADVLLGADFLGLFVSVLCWAGWHANVALDADGEPIGYREPFALHFVFLADTAAPADFHAAAASGRDAEVAVVDGRVTAWLTAEAWS